MFRFRFAFLISWGPLALIWIIARTSPWVEPVHRPELEVGLITIFFMTATLTIIHYLIKNRLVGRILLLPAAFMFISLDLGIFFIYYAGAPWVGLSVITIVTAILYGLFLPIIPSSSTGYKP